MKILSSTILRIMMTLTIYLGSVHPLLADERYRIYRSAAYLGRGDTGIANANNHEAIYYNPAGLAQGKGIYKETVLLSPMIELSENTKDLVRKVAIEKNSEVSSLREHIGKNQHLGIYNFSGIVLRRAAIGAVVSDQTNIIIRKDPEQGGLETIDASTIVNRSLSFGIAETFFDESFLFGTSIKYLARDSAHVNLSIVDAGDMNNAIDSDEILKSGTGYGVDVGMIFKMGGKVDFNLGILIENVGATKMEAEAEKNGIENLPQIINLGLSFEPVSRFSRLMLLLDIRDVIGVQEKNNFKKIHAGAQISLKDFLGVTGGLNQGYPTFGIFVNLYFVRVDLGMYTEEMGDRIGTRPDARYFFRLMAGF